LFANKGIFSTGNSKQFEETVIEQSQEEQFCRFKQKHQGF